MLKMRTITLPGETVRTTFLGDFDIADGFGIDGIRKTYEDAFSSWKHDYRYLTNLVVTLNYKAAEWAEKDEDIAEVYVELFKKTSDYALDTLKGDEFKYYFNITD